MNRPSNNDETNATQYVWDKYVYLVFVILAGIAMVTLGISSLIMRGIRSGLPGTLQITGYFLAMLGMWLEETGRKKFSKTLMRTGWITVLVGIIARYIFEGKLF